MDPRYASGLQRETHSLKHIEDDQGHSTKNRPVSTILLIGSQ